MPDQDLIAHVQPLLPPNLDPAASYVVALLTQQQLSFDADGHLQLQGQPLSLKPFNELYDERSKGSEAQINLLCMAIEFSLAWQDHNAGHSMQDAEVLPAFEKLSMKPEQPLSGLGAQLQAVLQLELSLRGFSRGDLRQAIRRCQRSAQRHHKQDGARGYLGFIHHILH